MKSFEPERNFDFLVVFVTFLIIISIVFFIDIIPKLSSNETDDFEREIYIFYDENGNETMWYYSYGFYIINYSLYDSPYFDGVNYLGPPDIYCDDDYMYFVDGDELKAERIENLLER